MRDELVMQLVSHELAAQIQRQNDPLLTSERLAKEIGYTEHGYEKNVDKGGVVGKLAAAFRLKKNVSKARGGQGKMRPRTAERAQSVFIKGRGGGDENGNGDGKQKSQMNIGGDSPGGGAAGGKKRMFKLTDVLTNEVGKEKLETLAEFKRDGWVRVRNV